MQNFTTSKDAQVVDVIGSVQTESILNAALKNGDSITSGTVLTLAQGSEITLAFEDGLEQRITNASDETLIINEQTTQQDSVIADEQNTAVDSATSDAAVSNNLQADIDTIQALIESGEDIEGPDTAAGLLNPNERTEFARLDRDGNELLAAAGYDTGELDNTLGAADVPVIFDLIEFVDPVDPDDPVNALPDAVDDTFGMNENTVLNGTLLGNDDLGDLVTTVTGFDATSVNGAVVTVDSAGVFTYTPVTDFVGADTFTYTITDSDGDESTATVTVNVANVNALPVAEDDNYSVSEGQSVGGNVITNPGGTDTNGGDGGTLEVTSVGGFSISGPTTFTIIDSVLNEVDVSTLDDAIFTGTNDNGILSINVDGVFTYENKGFLEVEDSTPTQPSFEYTISDGIDTDTAEVTINVVTNAPVANDDSNGFIFNEDNARTIGGNVTGLWFFTSTDNVDDFGSDGQGSPAVTEVVYNQVTYTLGTGNDSGNPISIVTLFGVLSIDNIGSYTFVQDPGLTSNDIGTEGVSLEFTYTIQDGDTLNSETSSADLVIQIRPPVSPNPLSIDLDFNETSGTIDTEISAKVILDINEAAFLSSPDANDLNDILTDGHASGLEQYLADMGKDEGVMINIELAPDLKNVQSEESVVLEKGDTESESASFTTVTNGLLAGGGTLVSDAAAAVNAPIAEFDSSDLL